MATPRVIAEFYKKGRHTQIVWVGIGKYEAWTDKRRVQKDMSHEEVIRYLCHCNEDGTDDKR
jgi:hypothetical protein